MFFATISKVSLCVFTCLLRDTNPIPFGKALPGQSDGRLLALPPNDTTGATPRGLKNANTPFAYPLTRITRTAA